MVLAEAELPDYTNYKISLESAVGEVRLLVTAPESKGQFILAMRRMVFKDRATNGKELLVLAFANLVTERFPLKTNELFPCISFLIDSAIKHEWMNR